MTKEFFNCRWLKILDIIYGFQIMAITIYPFIFYKNKNPKKMIKKHELGHIKQVKREGIARFSWNYCCQFFKFRFKGKTSREAHDLISYEKEAKRESI